MSSSASSRSRREGISLAGSWYSWSLATLPSLGVKRRIDPELALLTELEEAEDEQELDDLDDDDDDDDVDEAEVEGAGEEGSL